MMGRRASAKHWMLGLPLLVALFFLSCQDVGPSQEQPWIVVLERHPTAASAEKRSEAYRGRGERFERTASLSLSNQREGLQHVVALCGFASQGQARSAAKPLTADKPNRLVVLNVALTWLVVAAVAIWFGPARLVHKEVDPLQALEH